MAVQNKLVKEMNSPTSSVIVTKGSVTVSRLMTLSERRYDEGLRDSQSPNRW